MFGCLVMLLATSSNSWAQTTTFTYQGSLTINGTLNDARLSSNVALLNAANIFTANQTINANLTQSGTLVQFTPTDGFVAGGTISSGSIPTTGADAQMMWYPNKVAFRAGYVSGTQWDNANIGIATVAMGGSTTASGVNSVALGGGVTASGDGSVALGKFSTANAQSAIALGDTATASANYAIALGHNVTASNSHATALGQKASTNEKDGSFVYGDHSTSSTVSATADNQFVVRAQNLWFGTNNSVTATSGRFLETSTGGTRTNSSSRALKTNFAPVNARAVLQQVLRLPIQTWNYKAEDSKVRYIGAILQDFHQSSASATAPKASPRWTPTAWRWPPSKVCTKS